MNILFYIVGGIILAYWGYHMSQPGWNRPRAMWKNERVILIVGIALIVIGFMV